jgi:class 3 adenylate cyclase
MNKLGSADVSSFDDPLPIEVSGDEPENEHPCPVELVLKGGGNALGLIGAIPVLADAGPPARVPRSGVDSFVDALAAAIRIALTHGNGIGIGSRGTSVYENVTILFTDLVGWTDLASQLWPEVADELRHNHFATLRREIIASGGTEVKGLGDGSMVVFPTASAALSCAVAMQRGVDRDNCVSGHPLGLRIGLSGGEVTRECADYFGDPVIEAARLCACASGGKIFVTQVVKDMAGRRCRYPYRSLGRLELKGLPEPLEAFEVDWGPGTIRHRDPISEASTATHSAIQPMA